MSDLNARQTALFAYVHENPDKSAREIAEFFNDHPEQDLQATDNATRCALRRLVEKGLLEFHSTKLTRQHPKYRLTEIGLARFAKNDEG